MAGGQVEGLVVATSYHRGRFIDDEDAGADDQADHVDGDDAGAGAAAGAGAGGKRDKT